MSDVRMEERPVGHGGKMLKRVPCVGSHAIGCERTHHGWLCTAACEVEDHPVVPTMRVVVDTLLGVTDFATRRRLRVHWELNRTSRWDTFVNGRATPRHQLYAVDTWYSGQTWTRWGARREIEKAKKRPGVPERIDKRARASAEELQEFDNKAIRNYSEGAGGVPYEYDLPVEEIERIMDERDLLLVEHRASDTRPLRDVYARSPESIAEISRSLEEPLEEEVPDSHSVFDRKDDDYVGPEETSDGGRA